MRLACPPTPAGAAFLESAHATLAVLDRGVTAARNAARAISGQLSVGLNVAAGGELPTTALAAFGRAHPQVEVRLRTFDLAEPAAGLLNRSTDVAFVRPPIQAPGIRLESLARSRACSSCPPATRWPDATASGSATSPGCPG
jgi:DNA-binding transcriptional LysR family regulator